mmetsp:Transcript_28044/g.64669  ORF Transcript_28044/g.64669 Transcript_28044/m.64669 type:complete len:305 (-) Transcript_28044:1321-2235(-)
MGAAWSVWSGRGRTFLTHWSMGSTLPPPRRLTVASRGIPASSHSTPAERGLGCKLIPIPSATNSSSGGGVHCQSSWPPIWNLENNISPLGMAIGADGLLLDGLYSLSRPRFGEPAPHPLSLSCMPVVGASRGPGPAPRMREEYRGGMRGCAGGGFHSAQGPPIADCNPPPGPAISRSMAWCDPRTSAIAVTAPCSTPLLPWLTGDDTLFVFPALVGRCFIGLSRPPVRVGELLLDFPGLDIPVLYSSVFISGGDGDRRGEGCIVLCAPGGAETEPPSCARMRAGASRVGLCALPGSTDCDPREI